MSGLGPLSPNAQRALYAVAAGAALALAALAHRTLVAPEDPLGDASWIGHLPAARLGESATIGFARHLVAARPARLTVLLDAHGEVEFLVDGAAIPLSPAGAGPEASGLRRGERELGSGAHDVVAVVRHAEGVAALRLAAVVEEKGSGKRERVVTDGAWRVDDDAKRIRDRGWDGARYPATLWGRPPLPLGRSSASSGASSISPPTSSLGTSKTVESSRIPSRAEAQKGLESSYPAAAMTFS